MFFHLYLYKLSEHSEFVQQPYIGVIIEESLSDRSVLKQVTILSTKAEPVTPKHQTPHLKQWTLHTIEIPAEKADKAAEAIRRSLDTAHGHWFADFKNREWHSIIFADKIFTVERAHPEQYRRVVAHGLRLGIPDYQLDFSPAITTWKR